VCEGDWRKEREFIKMSVCPLWIDDGLFFGKVFVVKESKRRKFK